ncbi:DUF4288 domain-containing protein [Kangiella sp. TOML190]|uniref:DUF4288 domain-containing protein n=1 Tax=Kangiella sp. TOML190 TaxID=2931351 RepID=UPI00203BC537|nr:DUF4288 domain-containing protein [Kangiella sp. TOML190]
MYYSVNVLFKSTRSDSKEPLWEERILLIDALDEDEAERLAIKLCENEKVKCSTVDGSDVEWNFYTVERAYEIQDSIEHGTEIFSRFIKEREALGLLEPFEE